MKIAVLGASGFIGQNLVECLLKEGLEIIPVFFTHPVGYPKAISYDKFLQVGGKIDFVIFAAGNSNHNVENEQLLESIKKDCQYIQETFQRFEISRAVLLSSAAVYYGYEGYVDENTCPKPTTNYGISKRIAEMIFEKEITIRKKQGIVLRLTHAFGKGERTTRLLPNIARAVTKGETLKVRGKGESYINPIPVEFLCNVVKYFLNKNLNSELEYYNIGSKEKIKVRELVEAIQKKLNFQYAIEGEEKQEVKFIVKVDKLAKLGIVFPNPIESAIEYIKSFEKYNLE